MTPEQHDRELLDRWQKGDQDAGGELFSRYFDTLYGFFADRAPRAAEDLVQQTFLGLVSGAQGYRAQGTFRSYLLVAARRKLLDHYRTESRKHARLDFLSTTLADLGTPLSSVLARRQEERILHEALRHIPVDLQIAIDLFYFQGFSATEVAAVLEIPEGTVRSRLRRALDELRTQITQRVSSSPVQDAALSRLEELANRPAGKILPES